MTSIARDKQDFVERFGSDHSFLGRATSMTRRTLSSTSQVAPAYTQPSPPTTTAAMNTAATTSTATTITANAISTTIHRQYSAVPCESFDGDFADSFLPALSTTTTITITTARSTSEICCSKTCPAVIFLSGCSATSRNLLVVPAGGGE